MTRRLWKASTSLALILLVAFGARLAFAWDQERKIPDTALAMAPFAQETGNIAYSLVTGKGFSNPFRRDTGPTAWLTPVYPFLVAAAFKLFGIFTVPSFFFLVFLNIFFHGGVHTDFSRRQTRRGPCCRRRRRVAMGAFPQRDHGSVRMDLGHVSLRAAGGHTLVGDACVARFQSRA